MDPLLARVDEDRHAEGDRGQVHLLRGDQCGYDLGAGPGLLVQSGWKETATERFVNPEKFPGVWADFVKGHDSCRVTVIEGHHATHVDYTVARANRAL